MCIERHPDKGGSNKEFQDLLEAKDTISKYINEHIPENNLDEEEKFARHLFKEFILVKIHKTSVLLTYPTKYAKHYKESLENRYGQPVDKSDSGNGLKFSVPGGIFLTLYIKSGEESKLYVQGNKMLFEYVKDTLPEIFKDVLTLNANEAKLHAKRKLSPKPHIDMKCAECEISAKNEQDLKIHMRTKHTVSGQRVKKLKASVGKRPQPTYKILKSNQNSLKLTVKKAVQKEMKNMSVTFSTRVNMKIQVRVMWRLIKM